MNRARARRFAEWHSVDSQIVVTIWRAFSRIGPMHAPLNRPQMRICGSWGRRQYANRSVSYRNGGLETIYLANNDGILRGMTSLFLLAALRAAPISGAVSVAPALAAVADDAAPPSRDLAPDLSRAIARARSSRQAVNPSSQHGGPPSQSWPCGPIRLWPRSRPERAMMVAQAMEVGLTAVAESRMRPLTVAFSRAGIPPAVWSTYHLSATGPAVGVGGAARPMDVALGLIGTDLVDGALSHLLRIGRRARAADDYARALSAVDAGMVRIVRSNRAEAALRTARDACSAALVGASTGTDGIAIYSPMHGPGTYYSIQGPVFWGAPDQCDWRFVLPAGSPWATSFSTVGRYRDIGPQIAAWSVGLAGASRAVPLAIHAGRWAWDHALPRDRAERRALIADAGLALVDGLVTSAGTARGNKEMDPIVRPFVRGGFGEIVGSWVIDDAITSALTRRWSPAQRAALDLWGAQQHMIGIASWDRSLDPYMYPTVIDGMAMPATPAAPQIHHHF